MRSEGGMLAGSTLSQLQSWDACALRSLDSCAFQSRSILSSVTPPPSPGPVTRVTDCGTVVCVSAWPLSAVRCCPAGLFFVAVAPAAACALSPPACACTLDRSARRNVSACPLPLRRAIGCLSTHAISVSVLRTHALRFTAPYWLPRTSSLVGPFSESCPPPAPSSQRFTEHL